MFPASSYLRDVDGVFETNIASAVLVLGELRHMLPRSPVLMHGNILGYVAE
jgi:hypothetical protein